MAEAFGLGLDVGSTSVKACLLTGGAESWSEVRAHDGDVVGRRGPSWPAASIPDGTPTLVTGDEGRRQFRLERAIAPEALERALAALGLDVTAVVSVGGEDLVVYRLDAGRIVGTYAGNKCASGHRRVLRPAARAHGPAARGGRQPGDGRTPASAASRRAARSS